MGIRIGAQAAQADMWRDAAVAYHDGRRLPCPPMRYDPHHDLFHW
jgi:hypothetical protein